MITRSKHPHRSSRGPRVVVTAVLAALTTVTAWGLVPTAANAALPSPSILTSDFGSAQFDPDEPYCWRGFAFQVASPQAMTELVVSAIEGSEYSPGDTWGWAGGIYAASVNEGSGQVTPTALLGSVSTTQFGLDQAIALGSPVTLLPGNWYLLAEGATAGGDNYKVDHYNVVGFDSSALLAAHPEIAAWYPGAGNGDAAVSTLCDVGPADIVNEPAGFTGVRPAIGMTLVPVSVGDGPLPPPLLEQVPVPASGSCADVIDKGLDYGTGLHGGWAKSWAQWSGGAVCERTIAWSRSVGFWVIQS